MKVLKFQEGGQAPQDQAAQGQQPAGGQEAQGGDPMTQMAQLFAQGLQQQDCEMLAQGAQMFLQLVSEAQGQQQQQAPVYRRGGKLTRVK